MCEFCIQHGEGKKWYLLMKHFSDELLHSELSAAQQAEVRARTREELLRHWVTASVVPAATGVPAAQEQIEAAMSTTELHTPATSPEYPAKLLEVRKVVHFGQVIPLEDAEAIFDLATSITRMPCACRFISIGKTDKRYCFGLGFDPSGVMGTYPNSSSSLETLSREQSKTVVREYDREGLIHTVWTGVTPYIMGLCNCDRDCLVYRTVVEQRGTPWFFRSEYVGRIDPELCDGCRQCLTQCQFGAQHWSSTNAKVDIDPLRCFGCGLCRAACPADAISLIARHDEPRAANLWLS